MGEWKNGRMEGIDTIGEIVWINVGQIGIIKKCACVTQIHHWKEEKEEEHSHSPFSVCVPSEKVINSPFLQKSEKFQTIVVGPYFNIFSQI
jgi:hypothetical protein